MKHTKYKQFINTIPIETKTIIEYALLFYKTLEKEQLFIDEKDVSSFVSFKSLSELDKAFLAIFVSLLTVNTNVKKTLNSSNVDIDKLLEFIADCNKEYTLLEEVSDLSEEEKEKIYCSRFYFLNSLLHDQNIDVKDLTPESLAYLILEGNHLSSIIERFYLHSFDEAGSLDKHQSYIKLKELVEDSKKVFNDKTYLDEYGVNLSRKEHLQRAIGRDAEIRNIEIALLTPSKKGSILVGNPGVGKRTIVEGLARKIKEGDVPLELRNKEIIEIDLATIVAGTSYRGQLEERVKRILDEARDNSNVILFINGIHNGMASSEESNRIDFISVLGNYLSRGEISVIATTTEEDYFKVVLPNDNISSKLNKITVGEPSKKVIEEILYDSIDEISRLTKVSMPINDGVRELIINTIVSITSKDKRGYFSTRSNPDLARNLLERTFAIASINNHDEICLDDLIESVESDESLSKDARNREVTRLREVFNNSTRVLRKSNIIKFPINN